MNKIANSFIGGFFRRLGSLFAFLLVLFIVGYFLKDVKINVSDLLGISRVSALEIDGNRTRTVDFFGNGPYKADLDTCGNYGVYNIDFSANSSFTANDEDKFAVIYFNSIHLHGETYDASIPSTAYTDVMPFFALKSNSSWSYCELHNNFVVCPLLKGVTYNGLRIRFQKQTLIQGCIGSVEIIYEFDRYIAVYNTANSLDIVQSIENNTSTQQETNNKIDDLNDTQKETNEKLDDIKDTITDNNLSDDDIGSELNQLETDNQSLGFFTTFLTLPLTWVQNILGSSQSCRDLVVPLPYTNTNLTLPCMTQFWQNMGILGSLIQAVWLAIVGVRIFNGLFLLTVDTISSKDNVDELTKIRSWEL